MTVEIDFKDGKGFQSVLSARMPTAAPRTYKFGFSGSTGGLTDTHLLRGLRAQSVNGLGSLNLVKTVAATPPPAHTPYRAGDTVHYEFLATNTSPQGLHSVTVADPLVKDVVCPRTTLGPAGGPDASMVCTGGHLVTEDDARRGTVVNTATAQGLSPGGSTISSGPSSTTVAVFTPRPRLTLTKTASPRTAKPGDTVTYTVKVVNTGNTSYTPARFTDDLAAVLDDADYNGDAAATRGTVRRDGDRLRWSGDLAPGDSATITYSVTVRDPATGDGKLRNAVTTDSEGGDCADARSAPSRRRAEPPCSVNVPVVVPAPGGTTSPSPTASPSPSPTPSRSPSPAGSHHPTGAPSPGASRSAPAPAHGGRHDGSLADTGDETAYLVGAGLLACGLGAFAVHRRRRRA